jgi:POT family proton-dependent oligopeptide transporter
MAVNLGATISQLATPLIAIWVGWHVAFAVCAAGLVIGILNYFAMSRYLRHVGSAPDFQPLDLKRLVLVLVGIVVGIVLVTFIIQNRTVARGTVVLGFITMLAIFWLMGRKGSERERKGLIAVLILTGLGMLFFIFYQQMSTSLTLFSLRNVDLNFFGYDVPAGQVQALNPIWIFILSPGLAWLYTRLGRGSGGDFHISTKFAMGFAVLSLGFFIYGFSGHFANAGRVSFWWMIAGYAFISLGELLISGLGLAVIARYVGPTLRGFIMGVWFLATGISQYLGSLVATFASVPQNVTNPVATLPLYTNLFRNLGIVAVIGTVIAAALIPTMKKLSAVSEGPWEEVPPEGALTAKATT